MKLVKASEAGRSVQGLSLTAGGGAGRLGLCVLGEVGNAHLVVCWKIDWWVDPVSTRRASNRLSYNS